MSVTYKEFVRQWDIATKKAKTNQQRGLEKHLKHIAEVRQQRKKEYERYLESDTWTDIRRRKLAEVGAKCAICGSRENITVHHIQYPKVYGSEEMEDLKVLCWNCHKEKHVGTQ